MLLDMSPVATKTNRMKEQIIKFMKYISSKTYIEYDELFLAHNDENVTVEQLADMWLAEPAQKTSGVHRVSSEFMLESETYFQNVRERFEGKTTPLNFLDTREGYNFCLRMFLNSEPIGAAVDYVCGYLLLLSSDKSKMPKDETHFEYYQNETWVVDTKPCDIHDHQTEHCAVTLSGDKIGAAIYIDGEFECIDCIEKGEQKTTQP